MYPTFEHSVPETDHEWHGVWNHKPQTLGAFGQLTQFEKDVLKKHQVLPMLIMTAIVSWSYSSKTLNIVTNYLWGLYFKLVALNGCLDQSPQVLGTWAPRARCIPDKGLL